MDPQTWNDSIDVLEKFGFPMVFIIGLIRGWWYMAPHVALLHSQLKEALEQVERARVNEARAVSVAEQSHKLLQDLAEAHKRLERDLGG